MKTAFTFTFHPTLGRVLPIQNLMQQQHPLHKVPSKCSIACTFKAGFKNGYFDKSEEAQIADDIQKSGADMLFVGFSSPMKETFLNQWMPVMQVPFCMGVGGSFDIVAGKTQRAPLWMQEVGLEWFFRILQEPKRMWKRYAKTNPIFIWMVLRELVRKDIQKIK